HGRERHHPGGAGHRLGATRDCGDHDRLPRRRRGDRRDLRLPRGPCQWRANHRRDQLQGALMAKKYEAKTKPTDVIVDEFLAGVRQGVRRADAARVREVMEEFPSVPAVMWGPSIIGFRPYPYRYESGHASDAPRFGFSPRSANLVLYFLGDFDGPDALLSR